MLGMPRREKALSAVALLLSYSSAVWGSVVITGTRFVFPEAENEITVRMTSKNIAPVLVQTWIDDGDVNATPDKVQTPFLVTPPIARIDAGRDQSIRILSTGSALPDNHETVFYLNVLEVPAKPGPEFAGKNTMQLALRSRMKLFWRPGGLPGSPDDAGQQLNWKVVPQGKGFALEMHNPTPYYVTVPKVSVMLDGTKVENEEAVMVAPMGSALCKMSALSRALPSKSVVTYYVVNDFGTDVPMKGEVEP